MHAVPSLSPFSCLSASRLSTFVFARSSRSHGDGEEARKPRTYLRTELAGGHGYSTNSNAMGKERERAREKLGETRKQRDSLCDSLPPNISHVETPAPSILRGGSGSQQQALDDSASASAWGNVAPGGAGGVSSVDTAELEARLAALERTWQAAVSERGSERASVLAAWSVASMSEAPQSAYSPPQAMLPAGLLAGPALAVACRVAGVSMALDDKGRSFTQYRLMVLLAHGGTLEVLRRFSDFVKLHLKLTGLFPHLPLPKVANSLFAARGSWFNRFDPDLIQRRQVWLEEYLMALIRMPQCEASPPLRSFLAGGSDASAARRCASVALTADTWLATSIASQRSPPPVETSVADSTATVVSTEAPLISGP